MQIWYPLSVLQSVQRFSDPAAAKYDIEAWLPGQNNGEGHIEKLIQLLIVLDYQSAVEY